MASQVSAATRMLLHNFRGLVDSLPNVRIQCATQLLRALLYNNAPDKLKLSLHIFEEGFIVESSPYHIAVILCLPHRKDAYTLDTLQIVPSDEPSKKQLFESVTNCINFDNIETSELMLKMLAESLNK